MFKPPPRTARTLPGVVLVLISTMLTQQRMVSCQYLTPLVATEDGWTSQGVITLPADRSYQYRISNAYVTASCLSLNWNITDDSSTSSSPARVAVMLVPFTVVTKVYGGDINNLQALSGYALPNNFNNGSRSGAFTYSANASLAYAYIFYSTSLTVTSNISISMKASNRGCSGNAFGPAPRVGYFSYTSNPGPASIYHPSFSGVSCLAYGLAARQTTTGYRSFTADDEVLQRIIPNTPYLDQDLYLRDLGSPVLLSPITRLPVTLTSGKCVLSSSLTNCFAYTDNLDPLRRYQLWSASGQRLGLAAYPSWQVMVAAGAPTGSCASIFPLRGVADNATVTKSTSGPPLSPPTPTPTPKPTSANPQPMPTNSRAPTPASTPVANSTSTPAPRPTTAPPPSNSTSAPKPATAPAPTPPPSPASNSAPQPGSPNLGVPMVGPPTNTSTQVSPGSLQEQRIAALNATTNASAPVDNGILRGQQLYGKSCELGVNGTGGTATQITSGSAANIQSYPYMASIRSELALGGKSGSPSHFCGGTLIVNNVILTAAHCCDADNVGGGAWAPNLTTMRGQAIRNPQPVAVIGTACSNDEIGLQTRNIVSVIVHPLWDKKNYSNGYDICLMKTTVPFDFTDSLSPGKKGPVFPKLAQSTNYQRRSLTLQSLGWGQTSAGSPVSPYLKALDFFVLSEDIGQAILDKQDKDQVIYPNQVMATSQVGGTCSGDSGGPLLYSPSNHTDPSTDIIVGIVSYGLESCAAASWTIFTDPVAFWTQTDMPCAALDKYQVRSRLDAFIPCAIADLVTGFNLTNLKSNETGFALQSD